MDDSRDLTFLLVIQDVHCSEIFLLGFELVTQLLELSLILLLDEVDLLFYF